MPNRLFAAELMDYLAAHGDGNGEGEQLPSMSELSKEMGVSLTKFREQLEVAKALGFVEVRPRTGIRRQPYSFLPAVRESLMYALAVDCWKHFEAFSELRNQLEAAYWYKTVYLLTALDHAKLGKLVESAWEKLRHHPIQIPHDEHRQLHLTIYGKLKNPFVLGILEAYWQAYETVGLNLYADYDYLEEMWGYHEKMVIAICAGEYEAGYEALVAHKDMLYHHPKMVQDEG